MTSLLERHLLPRIERLESLIKKLHGGSGGGGSASFAGPVVANEAAAAAFPLTDVPDGTVQIFVLSHRSIWTKRNGVAGTQGVPPLSPHEVIAVTAGPAGVLTRTTYSDPALRIGINDIYIDPANILANDENDGLTPATPLKTGYELFRRWGWDDSKPIVGPNLATSPLGFLNINIMSDLVSPDSLPIKVTAAANSSGPRVVGGPSTILRTSTLTNVVTPMNSAAPLGGTRLTVRDNTLVNWAAFMVPNRRVRMLNGPAAGGTFQPQTDSGAGDGQVQCSACQTTSELTFSTVPTTVTPAVGNTYVIEQLVVCNLGEIDIDQELNPVFTADTFANFTNINIPYIGTPTGGSQSWSPKAEEGVLLNFYQCTFDRNFDPSLCNAQAIACYFGGIALTYTGALTNQEFLLGGGMNGTIPSRGAGEIAQVVINGNTRFEAAIDFDFVANNSICIISGAVRNAAFWNAHVLAGVNTAGHGLIVGGESGTSFFGFRGDLIFHGTVWGNGNGGAGLLIGSSCSGVGAPQNITGTQGDVKLANFSSTVGNNTFWQAATGIDVGATGVAGVASAASWALIAAAKGAPGYGGSVHNRDQNASFVAAETTA